MRMRRFSSAEPMIEESVPGKGIDDVMFHFVAPVASVEVAADESPSENAVAVSADPVEEASVSEAVADVVAVSADSVEAVSASESVADVVAVSTGSAEETSTKQAEAVPVTANTVVETVNQSENVAETSQMRAGSTEENPVERDITKPSSPRESNSKASDQYLMNSHGNARFLSSIGTVDDFISVVSISSPANSASEEFYG